MPLDRQKAFNTAYHGLAAQGFERSLIHLSCAYRGTDGKRCALGYMIPDEIYSPAYEGRGPAALMPKFFELLDMEQPVQGENGLPSPDISFLIRLQLAHDGADSPQNMKKSIALIRAASQADHPRTALQGRAVAERPDRPEILDRATVANEVLPGAILDESEAA